MELYGLVVKGTDLKFCVWLLLRERGKCNGEGLHLTDYVLFLKSGDGHLLYYSLYLLNKYSHPPSKKKYSLWNETELD